MAALTVDKEGLQEALARARGWDRTPGNWSATQITDGAAIIEQGLRDFYFPPPLPGEKESHVWSFLRPLRTITVWPEVTGTVSGSPVYATVSTVTATAAKFYASMVGKTFTFDTSGTEYTIAGYTSSTVITLTGDASGEAADDTFTIESDGDFRLPDDFADVLGPMLFSAGDYKYHAVEQTAMQTILQMRNSHGTSWSAEPKWFATQAEDYVEGTGQRYYLALDAIPNSTYVLNYRSAVEPDMVSAESYVRGGTPHVQTVIEAILAAAENMLGDEFGVHEAKFRERLAASVSFDRQAHAADTLGRNRDYSTVGSGYSIEDERVRRSDSGTMNVFDLFYL